MSFNGRPIITMPATPVPASIQFTGASVVAVSESIFTGQQQVQDWGGRWLEATLTMQSMTQTQGLIWRDFLLSLNGQANVFAFTSASATVAGISSLARTPSGYWCLKDNAIKWSIKPGLIYGFSLDIREAK